MKLSVLLLLVGSLSAINVKQGWVELPNCPKSKGAKDVPLAADLHNATWATCKVKTTPEPKEIGKNGKYVWSAPIIGTEKVKDHEHQVTHHPEGQFGPAGPKYALMGRGNRWVELPNCKGEKDEVILDEDVANATSATCKLDPESKYGKKKMKELAAAAAKAAKTGKKGGAAGGKDAKAAAGGKDAKAAAGKDAKAAAGKDAKAAAGKDAKAAAKK